MKYLLFLLPSVIVSCFLWSYGFSSLPDTSPPARVAEASRSLVNNGTLAAPEYLKFADDFRSEAISSGQAIEQDVFAVGRDDKLYPKHSILSAVVGAPFYAIFGNSGFWILQQLCLLFIFISLSRLSTRSAPVLLIFVYLFTQTLSGFHTHVFSYDLHGVALMLGGMALLTRNSFFGAMLCALTIFVRPAYLILIPFAVFARVGTNREYCVRLVGLIVGLGIFMLSNQLIFGSPFTTAYQAAAYILPDGSFVLDTHPLGFSLQTFLSEWGKKLFSLEVGALPYNLALIFWPLAIWQIIKTRDRFLFVTSLGAIIYTLFIFSYQFWATSPVGNRFLLPAVYLMILPILRILQPNPR